MKKNVFGRKFNRDTNERKALFKSLISSLIIFETIKTTEPKAKAIKADVDKIITKVKKNGDLAKRLLHGALNPQALEKLTNDIAPRFKNRQGGYTRIIRLGKRFGDNAMEVVMEFTEQPKALVSTEHSPKVTQTTSVNKKESSPKKAQTKKTPVSPSSKRKPSVKKKTVNK